MHFSPPFRGTFQLSLTVLVHYRFWDIFSLRSYFLLIFDAHYQGHLLWYSTNPIPFRLRGYHPLCQNVPDYFNYVLGSLYESVYTTSLLSYHNRFSLGCFLFVRHYLGNLNWFLFLVVLRCFNSDGSISAAIATECLKNKILIRTSRDQRSRAPTPGLSQLATSFISPQA